MKILTKQDLLSILKEKNIFVEEDEAVPVMPSHSQASEKTEIEGQEDKKSNILSPELKVRHKQSKYLYTIDSVDEPTFILRDPTGKKFSMDRTELEKDYVIG